MRPPDRSGVEATQRLCPARHVVESAQPDEAVGVVQVPELPQDRHTDGLLGFDELAVEQVDKHVALTGVQRVLPQFNDRASHRVAGHQDPSICWNILCYN
ncbi:hypothetical protein [Acrocarpospora sp. B8E8]|uniref:hypothetical protein n=1 Tax=Acrocarpospora sp. B8E8 TaxID=3153572 RepID=UPI00325FC5B5